MDNVNKTLAVHALVTLALCYLPGVIAAWLQIARGTKYSRSDHPLPPPPHSPHHPQENLIKYSEL
jgi:hypothetical protein